MALVRARMHRNSVGTLVNTELRMLNNIGVIAFS
jgi:hypothetical protein